MHLALLVAILLAIIVGFCLWQKSPKGGDLREGMGGYGIISGLGFNNNAKYCWKNPYDTMADPNFPGYCSVIGRVVV